MKAYLVFLLSILSLSVFSQNITQLSLTASGLTCSMCSKAIYKSLLKLPSVEKVDADIQTATYLIFLKPGSKIVLSDFKKAVQDAGFSVASLQIKANFTQSSISSGTELDLEGNLLFFPGVEKQILQGSRTLLVIDKDYLPEKDRRKYDRLFKEEAGRNAGSKGESDTIEEANATGKAGARVETGRGAGDVYHVIIRQS